MLRALLVPYPPRRFSTLTVEGLLADAVERTIVPTDLAADFTRLWKLSRLASHVRDALPPDLSQHVPECAESLARVVRWFYAKSPAKRGMPPAVVEGVEAIERSLPLMSREEMARGREALLLGVIEEMAAQRRERLREIERTAAADLASWLERERAAADGDDARRSTLRERLDAVGGYPATVPPDPRRPPEPGTLWRTHGWAIGLLAGLACGAVIALGAVGFDGAPPAVEPPVAAPLPTPARVAPADAGSPSVAADAAPAKAAAVGPEPSVPTAPAPSSNCPPATVEYEPAEIRIMQPFPRETWPPGPISLPPVAVERFCLDRDPVLVSDFEKCAAAGACRPRITCLDHPRNFPVNCVTWPQAEAYCRWRGAALPTVAQWERTLLPGSKVRTEPGGGRWEWVADAFPAEIFQRGPTKQNADGSIWGYMALQKQFVPPKVGGRICSWHKAPAASSRGNLSFRCALTIPAAEAPAPATPPPPDAAPLPDGGAAGAGADTP
jgi:formylglycine-generating enzyme required for sulfatase activity